MLVRGGRASASCCSVVTSTTSFTVISFLPVLRAMCYLSSEEVARWRFFGSWRWCCSRRCSALVRRRFARGSVDRLTRADVSRAVSLRHLRDPHDSHRCTGVLCRGDQELPRLPAMTQTRRSFLVALPLLAVAIPRGPEPQLTQATCRIVLRDGAPVRQIAS